MVKSASSESRGGDQQLTDLPELIVFYDGGCALCNRTVRWLLPRDRNGRLHYAPLQGSTAEVLRAACSSLPEGVETVALVEIRGDEIRVHLRSRAVFEVASYLSWPWPLLRSLRWLPAALTDLGYRIIARLRHVLSRGLTPAAAPSEEVRSHFLP